MSRESNSSSFPDEFRNPSNKYRDMPFWGWNGELNEEQIVRQITTLREMGMGGFHIHARSGLATPYLGQEFMAMVQRTVEEAKKSGLYAWLYDEDRYPSGYAGGMVTQDPAYVGRALRLSQVPLSEADVRDSEPLGCYMIRQNDEGELVEYIRAPRDASPPAGFRKIWCDMVLNPLSSWFNNHAYFDALNPQATERFVQLTHDKYEQAVGSDFGGVIPAIFTDEPSHTPYRLPQRALDEAAVALLPYTDTFPDTYRKEFGEDVFATLPEVVWDLASGYSQARYRYHEHTSELFAEGYSRTIQEWCRTYGIQYSGHLYGEGSLESQTMCTGDVMRHYRYLDIPGVDVLCDSIELTTVKQCQSASRQFGKPTVASELDGVTDWDFPFFCHKGHGDWQAALGVNLRVPHHALMSLAGEAKRDYPASIGEQSPWHNKYPLIADHFARIHVAMSAGRPCCRIGVIHPIESYWLVNGPADQTAVARRQLEDDFQSVTSLLLYGLLDFDFIAESLLPHLTPQVRDHRVMIGCMTYEVLIVPPCLTLRGSTIRLLQECVEGGVPIVFTGTPPALRNARPDAVLEELVKQCRQIPLQRQALFEALEPYRDLSVVNLTSQAPADKLLYQLRSDTSATHYLLISNTDRIGTLFTAEIRIRGRWQISELNTADGSAQPLEASVSASATTLRYCFHPHGHLLLQLTPSAKSEGKPFAPPAYAAGRSEETIQARVAGRHLPITLSEPNVFPLDIPEWRIGEGAWNTREEILRIEDRVRRHFALPLRNGVSAQPWCMPDTLHGTLSLRYTFECEISLDDLMLAGEQLQAWKFLLDDQPRTYEDAGFWCDQAIRKSRLPRMKAGVHTLTLTRTYTAKTALEPFYLLGSFGVRLMADTAVLTPAVQTLSWGDITQQGLPYYGGNIIYHASLMTETTQTLSLRIPSRMTGYGVPTEIRDNHATREVPFVGFRGALVSVALDGVEKGDLAFAPFQTSLGMVEKGQHKLDLTLYTNRQNCFGAWHQAFRSTVAGPDIWRLKGDEFSYDYGVYPSGISLSPLLVTE